MPCLAIDKKFNRFIKWKFLSKSINKYGNTPLSNNSRVINAFARWFDPSSPHGFTIFTSSREDFQIFSKIPSKRAHVLL